jgi:hypothetical protein
VAREEAFDVLSGVNSVAHTDSIYDSLCMVLGYDQQFLLYQYLQAPDLAAH